MTRSRLIAVLLLAVVLTGCDAILPQTTSMPVIVCGPAKPDVCERQARVIIASQGTDSRRIVRIQFNGDGNDYDLTFADGTTERMHVD